MLDTAFLTGCDKNTEWQLPWFISNYLEHNTTRLLVADFGMSKQMRATVDKLDNVQVFEFDSPVQGWFKKPRAIWEAASHFANVVCWLDTDCQVMGNIEGIFRYYQQDGLAMVEDRPWTKRRPGNGPWFNSGVVIADRSHFLRKWMKQCESNPVQGDQEVLYHMTDLIEKSVMINPIPHKYNTLRLDYIDGIDVKDPLIIHHTGEKGNQVIRGMM